MSSRKGQNQRLSRREFLESSAAGLAGGLLYTNTFRQRPLKQPSVTASRIYHAVNGTPAQNVQKVCEMAYGGIENFIEQDDIVLLRPNLQWPRNGYTNTEIGMALIDLILNRPGGFHGEIIVIEDQHRSDPHTSDNSGWCTSDKASNGPYNWFEVIQYYVENAANYPNGIHVDPFTTQINVSFQFLMDQYSFALADPHPVLTTYGGARYLGANERLDPSTNPFLVFKSAYPTATCLYVRRSDLRYTNAIARVSPLHNEYDMSYPVFKSQHSGLYVSLYGDHPTAWDPQTETFTSQRVKLINMTTLNHHSTYAGVTSVVKGHFGMVYRTFHSTGWPHVSPPTFYYAGGAIGYWMATIRKADLHMCCAERVGRILRTEGDAFQARALAISKDPIALDYYAGKYILFPAGGLYGAGGGEAEEPWSNDPSLECGYYRLTLEFCQDPLADHSIVNGTLDEKEMAVDVYDFEHPPGDLDLDGDVDLSDYRRFQACSRGPGQAPGQTDCDDADLNGDSDVDLSDFDAFLEYFTGAK